MEISWFISTTFKILKHQILFCVGTLYLSRDVTIISYPFSYYMSDTVLFCQKDVLLYFNKDIILFT